MNQPLHRLVYCSRNAIAGPAEAQQAELRQILRASRNNNPRDDVTGALLFGDDLFAQALEGPMAAVEAAFERIQCDPRHAEVAVLDFAPVAERAFGDWSMGFAGPLRPGAAAPRLGRALSAPGPGAGAEVLRLLRAVLRGGDRWAA